MPGPIDYSKCRGPVPGSDRECGQPVIAIVRPSGRRRMERRSCSFHLLYYMNFLREYTEVNRIVVSFLNTPKEAGNTNQKRVSA